MDYKIIYDLVRQIPRGRVATYGQLARLAKWGRRARHVGWAMHACPDGVPWHRVINSKGEISARANSDSHEKGLSFTAVFSGATLYSEGSTLNRLSWKRSGPPGEPSGAELSSSSGAHASTSAIAA